MLFRSSLAYETSEFYQNSNPLIKTGIAPDWMFASAFSLTSKSSTWRSVGNDPYKPKIVGITNFSRISSWIPKAYLGDTPNNTPAPLAGLTATEVAEFGGGSWSRTNIVYHEGTDLQSAAEHAISTIPPFV